MITKTLLGAGRLAMPPRRADALHPAARVPTALVGIALIVGGIILTSDFRGLITSNARRAIESMSGAERLLGRIQPWKTLVQRPIEDRVRQQVWVTRIIGATFAVAGVVMFLYGAFGIGHVTTN
jgi:hypothetical protein